ncbi:hypothetical protein ACGFSB_36135 [Streptomyces sp. NPDC048441]|uniref:hypothetical protein n=1 Tax=Streptomyces sp. NPDC048441 TaxID=3365552 RepID=UPI00371E05C6
MPESGPAATKPAESPLRQQLRAAIEPTLDEHPEHNTIDQHECVVTEIISGVLGVVLPHGKFLGDQLRQAEAEVQRVIALYEQWVKAGSPPLGTSLSRWWDARLVELHDAIRPPAT